MGTSPDVGGRVGIGRPLVPQYDELEATAHTLVARQGVGCVPSSIEVVFTQIGGNIWKYEASAPKPKLPMDVLVAVTHPEPKETSPLERQIYKNLVKELPLKLSLELQREKKKAPHERDPAFVILDQILQFAALVERWLTEIIEDQYQCREERLTLTATYPIFALRGWISSAESMILEMNALITSGSPDAIKLKDNINLLMPLIAEAKEVIEEKTEENRNAALERLAEQSLALHQNYEQKKLTNALVMVGGLLRVLIAVVTALQHRKAANALMTLSIVMEALIRRKRGSGCIDVGTRNIVSQIIEAFPEITETQRHHVTQMTYFLIIAYTTWVNEAAGSPSQSKTTTEDQVERIRSLAFALASTLISNSGVVNVIAMNMLQVLKINTSYQTILTDAIAAIAMNVLILAGAKGDKAIKAMRPLMKGMRGPLLKTTKTIKQAITTAEKRTPLTVQLSIAVRQAIIALKKTETSGYLEAIQVAIKPLQQKLQSSQYESEQVVAFAVNLLNSLYRSEKHEMFTTIVKQPA